jgi:hypothetical protein
MVTFDGVAAHDVQGIGHSWLSSHWHPAVAGDYYHYYFIIIIISQQAATIMTILLINYYYLN